MPLLNLSLYFPYLLGHWRGGKKGDKPTKHQRDIKICLDAVFRCTIAIQPGTMYYFHDFYVRTRYLDANATILWAVTQGGPANHGYSLLVVRGRHTTDNNVLFHQAPAIDRPFVGLAKVLCGHCEAGRDRRSGHHGPTNCLLVVILCGGGAVLSTAAAPQSCEYVRCVLQSEGENAASTRFLVQTAKILLSKACGWVVLGPGRVVTMWATRTMERSNFGLLCAKIVDFRDAITRSGLWTRFQV